MQFISQEISSLLKDPGNTQVEHEEGFLLNDFTLDFEAVSTRFSDISGNQPKILARFNLKV